MAAQKSKLSRELAKQAVIAKCRGYINAEPAVSLFKIKPWISVPKKGKNEEWPAGYGMKNEICDNQNIFDIYNLCKSVIICGQKEFSG